jgi:hypothetical protein
MIFRLLLASSLLLALTPNAFAQRVGLQAFGTAEGNQQPFELRETGSEIRKGRQFPDGFDGLVDDFTALALDKSTVPNGAEAHGHRKIAKTVTHDASIRLPLFFNAASTPPSCELPLYAPSPRLPREAELRRAIWYPAMAEAACEAGLPVHLYDALIIQESRYNPVAVSPKGATGLAQLMPSSARTLGVRNIWDPRENMRGGARYLRALLDEFGRLDLALAAYNAGAGRVRATGRVPQIAETMNYVSGILTTMQRQLALSTARRE